MFVRGSCVSLRSRWPRPRSRPAQTRGKTSSSTSLQEGQHRAYVADHREGHEGLPHPGSQAGRPPDRSPPRSQDVTFVSSADGRYVVFGDIDDTSIDPSKAIMQEDRPRKRVL